MTTAGHTTRQPMAVLESGLYKRQLILAWPIKRREIITDCVSGKSDVFDRVRLSVCFHFIF